MIIRQLWLSHMLLLSWHYVTSEAFENYILLLSSCYMAVRGSAVLLACTLSKDVPVSNTDRLCITFEAWGDKWKGG